MTDGAAAGAFAGVAQRALEITTRGAQSGDEAEEHRCQHGNCEREGENRTIQRNFGFGGNRDRWNQRDDRIQSERGEANADCAADDGENHAFDQELANQTPAARAECGADGEFFFARGGAGEHEIRKVRATDEQKQRDGAERQRKRRTEIAYNHVGGGNDFYDEARRIAFRINFCELICNDGEVGLCLNDADAGF